MEHFTSIAVWIVTLSGYLSVNSLPIVDIEDSRIDVMQSRVKCPSDSTFYSPSHVEEHCISAAVGCFLAELRGTVKEECKDADEVINQAVEFLEHAKGDSGGEAPKRECVCESWPLKPFIPFLNDMRTLMEQQNTAALS